MGLLCKRVNRNFRPIALSRKQYKVSPQSQWKTNKELVRDISNGAIFNGLTSRNILQHQLEIENHTRYVY